MNVKKGPETNSSKFKHFFINKRTFKALNFCFQIQGHLSFVQTLYIQLEILETGM